MKRMWPDEFNAILDNAQEVVLEAAPEEGASDHPLHRNALRAHLPVEEYERIWPLAEMRFRVGEGRFSGKAVTLITTNPHYHHWHPADGGCVDAVSDSGRHFTTKYVDIHFLLDDVRQPVAAA
jgi:hypothetical protein